MSNATKTGGMDFIRYGEPRGFNVNIQKVIDSTPESLWFLDEHFSIQRSPDGHVRTCYSNKALLHFYCDWRTYL